MASELFVERLHGVLESARGTAINTPTHSFNMTGLLTPAVSHWSPAESRGEMASMYRDKIVRKGAAWSIGGAVDVNYLAWFLNMGVIPNTSPSTPTNGVLTRLWAFVPTFTADDIKTATIIWDLDAQSLQSDYATVEQITLSNDATSEEGLTCQISGAAHFPGDVSTPTPATNIASTDLLAGQYMQLYLDTSTIGSTEVTARVLQAQHVLTTGVTYKYLAAGPASQTLEYASLGRDKTAHNMITTLTLEVPDMTQYDQFTAGTTVMCRVRHSGSLIESVTPDYYNYVEVDTYGVMRNLSWGENAGSNRTLTVTIEGRKDSTLGAPYRIAVQNQRTSL